MLPVAARRALAEVSTGQRRRFHRARVGCCRAAQRRSCSPCHDGGPWTSAGGILTCSKVDRVGFGVNSGGLHLTRFANLESALMSNNSGVRCLLSLLRGQGGPEGGRQGPPRRSMLTGPIVQVQGLIPQLSRSFCVSDECCVNQEILGPRRLGSR